MDGDLAKLPKIVELAKKYDALTMVDDAHGEGVLGEGGRGVVNHFGLEGEVDIEIGSLSKAFSVMGGSAWSKRSLGSDPARLLGNAPARPLHLLSACAPGGSGQLGTPRLKPGHWDPSHRPRVLERAASKVAHFTAPHHAGGFIAAKQPLIDHYLMNARQR